MRKVGSPFGNEDSTTLVEKLYDESREAQLIIIEVIGPEGEIIGSHYKNQLTSETATEQGSDRNVFQVKGIRMGIAICGDGAAFYFQE